MDFLDNLVAVLFTPFAVLAAFLGTKYQPAFFYPTKPQLFSFKRRSPSSTATTTSSYLDSSDGSETATPASDRTAVEKTEQLSIRDVLETRVPSALAGYNPSWWLPNGHAQTAYVVAGNFTKVDQIVYERTLIALPDGGTLGLDMVPSAKEAVDLPADTPIVVVQHGLTGGSYEPYVRSILAAATLPKSKGGLGLRAFVVNFRGCANIPFTSPMIYSAQNTDDLRSGLLYITSKYPDAPLHGVGFSLGANIITRYLGEEGSSSRLRSALALACPWDLKANSDRLEGHWIGRNIYSKAMGSNLHAMFKAHVDEWHALPEDDRMTPLIPKAMALKSPTLKDIDHNIISQVGGRRAPFPFKTADEYYVSSSSHISLPTIRVPYLALNSADDPIVAHSPISEITSQSTSCALVVTKHGGHLGWFTGGSPVGRGPPPDRWVRKPALEWLRACVEDYVPEPGMGRSAREDGRYEEDGFVKEKEMDHVGFKVIEEGIVFDGVAPAKNLSAGL